MSDLIEREAVKDVLEKSFYGEASFGELLEAIDSIRTIDEKHPQWISVEERLPVSYETVIICRKSRAKSIVKVEQGRLTVNGYWEVYGTRTKSVTHWMPLPEPPKGEEA